MNTSRMRHIDHFLGDAVCLVLDALERIRRLFPRRRLKPEPRTVVVTKYLGMGSILQATPALKALKALYPSCRIILLTFESTTAFARRIALFDDVLSIRTSNFPVFVFDTLKALYIIRKCRADYIFDLEFFARFSTIVSYLSGAACKVGYYMPQIWRGDLLDIPVHFNPYRHVSEIFAAQFEAVGIKVENYTIVPPEVDDEAKTRVRQALLNNGARETDPIIAINVNASDLSFERRWPREHFVTLIDNLSGHTCVSMVLVGSPGEHAYVQDIHESLSPSARARCINMAGEQSLDELIALLAISDACITNDSGPLHIAASLGIKTASFFGPESPQLYGPRGDDHIVFYAGIYCSPCLNVQNAKKAMCSGNNVCLQMITPEQVISKLASCNLVIRA